MLGFETQEYKKDGSVIWVSANYRAIYDTEGNIDFIDGVVIDITERKMIQDQLKVALYKATESDRLKSTFLATMSHELRTPLNAVIGFSDIINNQTPIEDVVKYNTIVNSSGKHLLKIVEELFDLTLIEAGEIKIDLRSENLHAIFTEVEDIVQSEQHLLGKDHLKLNLGLPTITKDVFVNTDASKVKQLLINLLGNALKFTNEGSVDFGYTIESTDESKFVKFFVADTGIGIPESKRDVVFDVFRQVDETMTREYGGTGIGLSISKKVIEMLGGEIWFESEINKGTTFYFTIPIESVEEVVSEPTVLDSGENTISSKTILIVEDDESSYEFLKTIIELQSIKTLWAQNGKESVEMCESNTDIDLVLMDINMPVMNGYIATENIKKSKPTLPIIAQTAYAIVGDKEKALKAGCDDYISKPIKKDDLINLIEKYL